MFQWKDEEKTSPSLSITPFPQEEHDHVFFPVPYEIQRGDGSDSNSSGRPILARTRPFVLHIVDDECVPCSDISEAAKPHLESDEGNSDNATRLKVTFIGLGIITAVVLLVAFCLVYPPVKHFLIAAKKGGSTEVDQNNITNEVGSHSPHDN